MNTTTDAPAAASTAWGSHELLRAVADAGYQTPTPSQRKALPPPGGGDLVGCAQTVTGKTAAFCEHFVPNNMHLIHPEHPPSRAWL